MIWRFLTTPDPGHGGVRMIDMLVFLAVLMLAIWTHWAGWIVVAFVAFWLSARFIPGTES